MNTSTAEKKGLSAEAQKWIGIGALVACLLVGAGVVYFLVFGSAPRKRTASVDPKQQSMGVDGRLPIDLSRREMPGVHRIDPNTWLVRGKSGAMRITRKSDAYVLTFDFGRGFIPPDQVTLVAALIRAQTDAAMAKEWGISPEQVAELKKLNFRQSLFKPSAEDRAALTSQWSAFHAIGEGQAKLDAQRKMIEKLDAVAQANLDAARKAFIGRLDTAKQILTAEQLQKLTGH